MLGIRGSASSANKSKTLRIKPEIVSIKADDFFSGENCFISIDDIFNSKAIINGAIFNVSVSIKSAKGKDQIYKHEAKISRKNISGTSLKFSIGAPDFKIDVDSIVKISVYIKARGVESSIYNTTATMKKPAKR